MLNKNETRVVWAMIFIYIAVFGTFTALRHYNFQTQTWDMGIFVQTFWNTIHGRLFTNNLEEVRGPLNFLAVHMRPFLILLAPGYWLFPSPYYLLIAQTLALALGAWPLFLLTKKITGGERWALLMAAAYLLYPGLHWVNIFDFHEITFLPPLLMSAFYFLEIKKMMWAGVFLALAAATKEDAILAVLFVGLYLLLKKSDSAIWLDKERKIGVVIVLLSAFSFLLSTQVIMPALGGGLLRLDRYAYLGDTPSEIIKNALSNPTLIFQTIFNAEKLRYLLWLFLPVAFLPLFSGKLLLILIPGLLENLLTDFQLQFSGFYQYDAILIGGVFTAAAYGLKNLLNKQLKKEILLSAVLITAMLIGYFVRSPLNPVFFPIDLFRSNPYWDDLREIVKLTPPRISVAAPTNLVPHLAHREHIYMLGTEPFSPDLVIIDAADLFGFKNEKAFQNYTDNYLNSGLYDVQTVKNRYLVLTKIRP